MENLALVLPLNASELTKRNKKFGESYGTLLQALDYLRQ